MSVANLPASFTGSVGPTLFTTGDQMALNPVEGCTIFVSLCFLAAVIEIVLADMRMGNSTFFNTIFASVAQETLIVGLMTLLLNLVATLGQLSALWVAMLQYAVVSLLFMVISFVVIVSVVSVALRLQLNVWKNFEGARMDQDPRHNAKEGLYTKFRDKFRETLHQKEISFPQQLLFTSYVGRRHHHVLALVADLDWKAWLVLAAFVAINGVRQQIVIGNSVGTKIVTLTTQQNYIDLFSYILCCGYAPVMVFLLLHSSLESRAQKFGMKPLMRQHERELVGHMAKPTVDLFFGETVTTAQVFQLIILILEWYLAFFILVFANGSWSLLGPLALVVYIAALVPLCIFVAVFPWTILLVTLMCNVGTDLDEDDVEDLIEELRQQQSRAHSTTELARLLHGGDDKARSAAAAATGGGGLLASQNTVRDEWNGAPITLHSSATIATQLDETNPVELKNTTRRNLEERDPPETVRRRELRALFNPVLPEDYVLPGEQMVHRIGSNGRITSFRFTVNDPQQLQPVNSDDEL